MSDHPEQTDADHALSLLFEERPIELTNQSCLSGLTAIMYNYYKNYVHPLIDFEFKYKEEWEIPYDLLSELEYVGAGAYGKVYSAKLRGEVVAVKIPEDKKETDMIYLRELQHENIVRFRGVCTKGPNYCIIMDFCQYGSLYNFLHSGTRVMINRTLRWAKEIALAMSYLHSKNIIHRDLKSPNVLIADNLVCKVSDFGTSRKWEKLSLVMTTRGTTYWMAPEMMLGKKCSDKVDVWSYGVVLWELLTQEVPYEDLHPCAVTYGVGRGKISLPLPSTFPLHMRILLSHCWNRVSKSRPSFARIADVLTLACDQWSWLGDDLFNTMQDTWRQEVQLAKKNGWQTIQPKDMAIIEQPPKQNGFVHKKIMREASKMYMDACALYLRLEQREVDIAQRELAYQGRSSAIAWLNRRRGSTSSSSGLTPAQMTVVKLHQGLTNRGKTVTKLTDTASLPDEVTRLPRNRKMRIQTPKTETVAEAAEMTTEEVTKMTTETNDVNGNEDKKGKIETSVNCNANVHMNDNYIVEPVAV
ncbi:mitogen-activated protein kinase kinase kinase 13-A [Amyelois transitella]|uniref:mitogen-activated protein kinase kinase kinase 13-A n=1 Tax=Amyelois transitella TaxID=680683 RepID=UPI0029902D15|nr:mitogen-activated protein kinase kinase kinase 13-A [Amyelois transitella]